MINFGQTPTRSGTWSWLKPFVTEKSLMLQYEEDASAYLIYGYDLDGSGPAFALAEERDGLVEIQVEPAWLEPLRARDNVVLEGFPWDGGLALELRRVPSPVLPGALHVDGRATPSEIAALYSFPIRGVSDGAIAPASPERELE